MIIEPPTANDQLDLLSRLLESKRDANEADSALLQMKQDEISFMLQLVNNDLQDRNFQRKKKVSANNRPPPKDYVCRKCSIPGHWISDCPNIVRKKPPPGYVCHRCNNPGHFIDDCPLIMGPTDSSVYCTSCGSTEHQTHACLHLAPVVNKNTSQTSKEGNTILDENDEIAILEAIGEYNEQSAKLRQLRNQRADYYTWQRQLHRAVRPNSWQMKVSQLR